MKKFLSILLVVVFSSGCGDFLSSSKNDPPVNPERKMEDGGDNSFPADYDPNAQAFSESHMLANIGLSIIQPEVKNLRLQTELLENKIKNHCDLLRVTPEASDQEVKTQWKEAMIAFHRVDASPVGPMDDNGRTIGDNLYSWPNVNSCSIDVEVEKLARTKLPNDHLLISVKGFGGLEYLFFSDLNTSSCPLASPRFADLKKWLNEKTEAERRLDRCQMAHHLAKDMVVITRSLERSWDSRGGNFSKVMVDGSRYPSMKEAVNAMSDAMFAVEEVKDERLGGPLGMHRSCPSSKCVDLVEHSLIGGEMTFDAIQARIEGFKKTFFGSRHPALEGHGFDDYLKKMNRQDVALKIQRAVEGAEAQLAETRTHGSFYDQVVAAEAGACQNADSQVSVCKLYRAVREISNHMKTDFLIALSLRAPPTYQGDND